MRTRPVEVMDRLKKERKNSGLKFSQGGKRRLHLAQFMQVRGFDWRKAPDRQPSWG
jgi:hypothetical protein